MYKEKVIAGREVKVDEKGRVRALYDESYGWVYPYMWDEKFHCWSSVGSISRSTFYRWTKGETSIKWN